MSEFLETFRALWSERAASHWRGRALVRVWDRAAGACHLCGLAVPHPILELDAVTDDNAPTIDHVIPASKGGTRGKKNVRLAHRWCNWKRGDKRLSRLVTSGIRAAAQTKFEQTRANEQSTA